MLRWSVLGTGLLLLAWVPPAEGQVRQDGAAQRAATLRVRPGDQVALRFLREPLLSGAMTVSERGEAAFPKLGTFRVDTFTIDGLQEVLRQRYAEYLRSPELEVTVLRRVVVNGEVKLPNVYMVDIVSTVRDVIARAGGVTESGNRGNVVVVRDGERMPAKRWELGEGFELMSGDQIVVGRKNWFVINAIPAISTAVLLGSFVLTVASR
jgi:polysaccharide export outer membrane protein